MTEAEAVAISNSQIPENHGDYRLLAYSSPEYDETEIDHLRNEFYDSTLALQRERTFERNKGKWDLRKKI